MRIRALLAVVLVACMATACGGRGLFRQYEYEEDMYLSLDGGATVYVNSSVPALNALRGTSFDVDPDAHIDRDAVRQYFSSPNTHVNGRVTTSHRRGRQFVHVRVDVDDVTRLSQTAPFAWSHYDFHRADTLYYYVQTVGASARNTVGSGLTGQELVAFRLHLPSKIDYHNTKHAIGRGNILAWEQPLADRLHSVPLVLEARMQTQSILYRTLWLFGWTFVAVAITFGLVIWWVLRRGRTRAA